MIKKIVRQKFKGSAIIVTFLVLLIILTTALSLALVTVKDMKASIGASKSNVAYQAADEGVEVVMADILANMTETNKFDALDSRDNCNDEGVIKTTNYIVEFLDDSDQRIDCDSNAYVKDIKSIKSVGIAIDNTAQRSERAIKVPVKCPSDGCPL